MVLKIKALDHKHLESLIKEEIRQKGYKCSLNHIDTSNIRNMSYLFCGSNFNGSISQWNTSNVVNMNYMFMNSKFNQDISNWDVSKVQTMLGIFKESFFNQNISNWDVSELRCMTDAFYKSNYTHNLEKWSPKNLYLYEDSFSDCPAPIPYWAQVEPEFIQKAIESYEFQQRLNNELTPNKDLIKAKKI